MGVSIKILDSITKDIDLAEIMLKLLEAKKHALEHFDSSKLEKLVPEIDKTIESLEENQTQRNVLLNSLNLSKDEKTIMSTNAYNYSINNFDEKLVINEYIQLINIYE